MGVRGCTLGEGEMEMEGAPVSCGSGLVYKIMSTDNAPLGNLTRPVLVFPYILTPT